jgi:hypothetical protein
MTVVLAVTCMALVGESNAVAGLRFPVASCGSGTC